MNRRILKVYEAFTGKNEKIPSIRLQGKWLQQMGFEIGDNIIIREEESKLIIEAAKVLDDEA